MSVRRLIRSSSPTTLASRRGEVGVCSELCAAGQPTDQTFADASKVSFFPLSSIFYSYLRETPLAYALFRSAECRHFASVKLLRPVLDLGCSVGEFAKFAVRAELDMGVDLLSDRLTAARETARHRVLAQADAARLPVADEHFASVAAVSVCEHFAEPLAALAEIHRVLKPGGRFVASIVLADLHQHLFYPRLMRRAGLRWLPRQYLRVHDYVFDHRVLKSRQWWESRLAEAGFNVVASRKIVAPHVAAWFDFWLATAWPYRLWRRLGTPRVWRPNWLRRQCWRIFQQLDTDQTDGAALFVVAEKRA